MAMDRCSSHLAVSHNWPVCGLKTRAFEGVQDSLQGPVSDGVNFNTESAVSCLRYLPCGISDRSQSCRM